MGDLSIFDLSHIKNTNNINVLVETGTFKGDGTLFAKSVFDTVHSIEIDEELYNDATERFKDEPNINIYLGNSVDILPRVLPAITENVLFWLDAHFPGADCHKKAYDSESDKVKRIPLTEELKLICSLRSGNDVIIIDDLWLYEDGPFAWGSWDDHSATCGFNVTREDLMKGETLDESIELLSNTHNIRRQYDHQGYLICTPII